MLPSTLCSMLQMILGLSIGIMLASTAVADDKHATFMPLYGPEQRGGSAKCTVIISDEEIVSPLPRQTDGLIAMNDSSFRKFNKELRPGGLLVRNTNLVVTPNKRDDVRVLDVPADDLAHEMDADKASNIILVGAMLGFSDMMDPDVFMKSLEHKFAKKGEAVVEMNRKALYRGYELGKAAKEQE